MLRGTLLAALAIFFAVSVWGRAHAADDGLADRLAEAQKKLEEKKAAAAKAAAQQPKPATQPVAAASDPISELRTEVARLQAENAALRQQLAAAGIAPAIPAAKPVAAPAAVGKVMTPAQVLAMIPANLRPVAGQRLNPIQEQRLDDWMEANTKGLSISFTGKFDANGAVREYPDGKAIDIAVTADKVLHGRIEWDIVADVRVGASFADDVLTLKRDDPIQVTGDVKGTIRLSYLHDGTLRFSIHDATFTRLPIRR